MAEETTIALKVEIGGTERAITSLKDLKAARKDLQNEMLSGNQSLKSLSDSPALAKLKTALKEAQNAALNGDGKAAKRVAELQNEINDLKDSVTTFSGSGLERARASFDMLKESFKNLDFGKLQTALKGLGSAFKALLPFAIIELVMYLKEHFEELSQGSGLLAKSLRFVADIISQIGDGLNWLTDNLKLTNTALDEMGEDTVKNAEASKEALSQQNAEYDRQIKVAKAAGESTVELEKAKQQAIIDTNIQIVKQIEAFVRAGGVLDEEKKKLLTASLEGIKNAATEQVVIEETYQAELKKKDETAALERKKIADKENEEAAARVQAKLEMLDAFYTAGFQKEVAFAQAKLDYNAQVDAALDEQAANNAQKKRELLTQEDAEIAANLEKRKEGYKQFEQSKYELSKQSLQAVQTISDLVFAHQLRQAAGNAAKEREIKKKQFNLNKAFGIAGATIDGVQAVQKALNNPYPLNIVLAILSGAMAVANVVKIASTKFDDGGGSGGADVGGIGGGISGGAAPAIASPNNTVTKIDDNGQIDKAKSEQPVVKAVVVETDITDKQKRVNTIQEGATI